MLLRIDALIKAVWSGDQRLWFGMDFLLMLFFCIFLACFPSSFFFTSLSLRSVVFLMLMGDVRYSPPFPFKPEHQGKRSAAVTVLLILLQQVTLSAHSPTGFCLLCHLPGQLLKAALRICNMVLKPHSWTTVLSRSGVRSLILLELSCGFQSGLTQSTKARKWSVLYIPQ